MLKYILNGLLVVMTAMFLAACGGSDDDDNAIGGGPGGSEGPATVADYQVKMIGPGGHSNGAYGNTNALHAAARAVMAFEAACNNAGVRFHVKEIHGGNSVNAIASDGYFTVGLVSGTDEATFKTLLEQAASTGMNAENAFRGIKTDQKNNDGQRLDIRVDSITKL